MKMRRYVDVTAAMDGPKGPAEPDYTFILRLLWLDARNPKKLAGNCLTLVKTAIFW
jgi:hypothetical protein